MGSFFLIPPPALPSGHEDTQKQALGKYCFYSLPCLNDNTACKLEQAEKVYTTHKRVANNNATDIFFLLYINTGMYMALTET